MAQFAVVHAFCGSPRADNGYFTVMLTPSGAAVTSGKNLLRRWTACTSCGRLLRDRGRPPGGRPMWACFASALLNTARKTRQPPPEPQNVHQPIDLVNAITGTPNFQQASPYILFYESAKIRSGDRHASPKCRVSRGDGVASSASSLQRSSSPTPTSPQRPVPRSQTCCRAFTLPLRSRPWNQRR